MEDLTSGRGQALMEVINMIPLLITSDRLARAQVYRGQPYYYQDDDDTLWYTILGAPDRWHAERPEMVQATRRLPRATLKKKAVKLRLNRQ
jgi:hypothetical protein